MFYVLLMKLCSLNKKNADFEHIIIYFSVKNKGGGTIREGPQFETTRYNILANPCASHG